MAKQVNLPEVARPATAGVLVAARAFCRESANRSPKLADITKVKMLRTGRRLQLRR